jgi:hypothetical protein
MSDVIDVPDDIEPGPIEIERCEQCGCVIEDLEELIHLRAADLVTQWELADVRDAWRHTGKPSPQRAVERPRRPEPYEPKDSTIAAFWHVVRLNDGDYLRRWLARHPADAPHLLEIWERKNAVA